ncbi:hypothetical protein N656DRAFT_265420 [Canariomyces notabilis]|uniref:Uncharacterized protein n=1 Tax=Canariomyces notabilis TaxID=2074819 RepID=A0AAN6TLL9_9PEZI|nr:hypothetical protein N656DRAFT_265420 [Canariomyces arenarius]
MRKTMEPAVWHKQGRDKINQGTGSKDNLRPKQSIIIDRELKGTEPSRLEARGWPRAKGQDMFEVMRVQFFQSRWISLALAPCAKDQGFLSTATGVTYQGPGEISLPRQRTPRDARRNPRGWATCLPAPCGKAPLAAMSHSSRTCSSAEMRVWTFSLYCTTQMVVFSPVSNRVVG